MTPEQAADAAVETLTEAHEHITMPEVVAALVGIAAGWTRLYEALRSSPPAEPIIQLAPNHNEIASVYRERAALVAHLAAVYPSTIVHGADPSAPDWPVVFIDTPQGQMSWHLSLEDLGLFGHVKEFARPDVEGAPKWDGHTTAEKYERLHALTAEQARFYKSEI